MLKTFVINLIVNLLIDVVNTIIKEHKILVVLDGIQPTIVEYFGEDGTAIMAIIRQGYQDLLVEEEGEG